VSGCAASAARTGGNRLPPTHAKPGPAPRPVFDLVRWVRPALAFVADRRDLGRLLLSEGDVTRGELSAFPRSGPPPSHLVYSVMIARDLDDKELERAALDTFARSRDRPSRGWAGTFGAAVAHWATRPPRGSGWGGSV
jgi:hypothetical protein